MRGRDLDSVQAGRPRRFGRPAVAADDLVDLLGARAPAARVEAQARNRRGRKRGRPRRARDPLPPTVEELDEEPCAVRLHGPATRA